MEWISSSASQGYCEVQDQYQKYDRAERLLLNIWKREEVVDRTGVSKGRKGCDSEHRQVLEENSELLQGSWVWIREELTPLL